MLCPGAPGPVAGALAAAHRARLEPGPAFVLDALDADARMRAARAVIGGTGRLEHASLRGLFGELGTRARQSGVPFHAVVAEDALDPFGKRILDLQRVLVATDRRRARGRGRGARRATSPRAPPEWFPGYDTM